MCDTIVAVQSATKSNKVIIAKNSDRYENEAHIVIRIPAKKYDLEKQPTVRVTHTEVPQVSSTNAIVLLKPEWLWGCEMGFNEFGLNIANEAVFTKEKHNKKTGLLGMDIMRLVLERCTNPIESVDLIAKLIMQYGQGGNCKKNSHGKMYYHNSFIIADKNEAWVMETAGEYWVAKKVKDVYSISNRLTITNDYDLCHPEVIKNAISKGYCKDEKSFSFADCYSDFLYTKFACGKERRDYSLRLLEKDKGNLTVKKM